jgi:peptide/nickel transport system permease protein|tara:strand:- start:617 stop:1621 length:1005 start_codon:yes stop_codon:yes gene_type:complete
MLVYILQRSLLAILTIWVLSVISWVVIELPPGDYVTIYVRELSSGGGDFSIADDGVIATGLREQYGLDSNTFVRYWKWIGRIIFEQDLGTSMEYGKPVSEVVGERLLMTFILALTTAVFAWGLAVPIGIYSAVRQHSPEDYVFTFIGFLGLAVPDFLLALWLMWVSFSYFGTSIGGLFSPEYINEPWSWARLQDLLEHLWIAAFVVGTAGTAALIRVMRANLLDELNKPYVITARAKGMKEWKMVMKYPVRVALNPLISTLGYLLPFLISGAIIVSVVLNLPTEGPLLLRALLAEDMFISATIVMVLGVMTVLGTLLSDILLGLLDPRIRMTQN